MDRPVHLHMAGSPEERRVAGLAFDWLVVAAGAWLTIGAYLDGWAHNHVPSLETFFTPWHGVLYSGFAALVAVLVGGAIRYHVPGEPWIRAIPRGYGPAYVGAVVFMAAGIGDMLWHQILGIEVNVEALVSPTHLSLATGAVLLQASPFRAAWMRATPRNGLRESELWPAILSLTYVVSVIGFFTVMFHPLGRPWALAGNRPIGGLLRLTAANPSLPAEPSGIGTVEVGQILGLASLLIFGAVLGGVATLAVRRWGTRLPFGAFTVMFTLSALAMGFMRDELALAPVGLLGGIAADLLLRFLGPSESRIGWLRLYGLLVPATYVAIYFGFLQLVGGTWWTPPLWAGGIFYAGVAGLLESYLVTPTPIPAAVAEEVLEEKAA